MTTREKTTARPRTGRGNRTRYVPKRKVCFFCANKNEVIDYKYPEKLRGYISDRAKIETRRRTGTCAKHQRALAIAIKRARHLALLPSAADHSFTAPVANPPVPPASPAAPVQDTAKPPASDEAST